MHLLWLCPGKYQKNKTKEKQLNRRNLAQLSAKWSLPRPKTQTFFAQPNNHLTIVNSKGKRSPIQIIGRHKPQIQNLGLHVDRVSRVQSHLLSGNIKIRNVGVLFEKKLTYCSSNWRVFKKLQRTGFGQKSQKKIEKGFK